MFCGNCGYQTGNNDKFCQNCGAPVTGMPAMSNPGITNGSAMPAIGNPGITNGSAMPQMMGGVMGKGAVQAAGQAAAISRGIGRKAKFVAVIGILMAGIIAFVNTYVSGPEDTLESFCNAWNHGDMNEVLGYLDETSENTIRGTMDLTMGMVDGVLGMAGLGGFGIDGDTMIDMMPGLWEMSGMSEEIPELKVSRVSVQYKGNDFLDFLESIHVDLEAFYKVFSKEAEVQAVLEMGGESETIVITMENENFGKWKIQLTDWLRENT